MGESYTTNHEPEPTDGVLMMSMDTPLADLLGAAAAQTAKVEFQPIADSFAYLRKALDDYESVARLVSERVVVERVFKALGGTAPPSKVSESQIGSARDALLARIREVEGLLPPPVVKTNGVNGHASHVPVPVAVQPPPPPPVAKMPVLIKAPAPPTDAKDEDQAKHLIQEIEELRKAGAGGMSPLRLLPLLQAIAAEARYIVERLPDHDPLHRSLVHEFRNIVQLKEEASIPDFINGLSRDARGDWLGIARDSRRAVAKFDRDLAASEKPKKKAAPKQELVAEPQPIEVAAPTRFPALLKHISSHGPLPVVGGLEVQERIQWLKNDFGIDAEWYATEKKSPRQIDAVVARVTSGKMPALVLLEQFMSSTAAKMVVKACDTSHVPYVTAGRGGTGAVELALMALEGRLAGK